MHKLIATIAAALLLAGCETSPATNTAASNPECATVEAFAAGIAADDSDQVLRAYTELMAISDLSGNDKIDTPFEDLTLTLMTFPQTDVTNLLTIDKDIAAIEAGCGTPRTVAISAQTWQHIQRVIGSNAGI